MYITQAHQVNMRSKTRSRDVTIRSQQVRGQLVDAEYSNAQLSTLGHRGKPDIIALFTLANFTTRRLILQVRRFKLR